MTVYGYGRVSTAAQHLDAQIEQLTAAGCQHIYKEKVSGAKDDRPELTTLMGRLTKGDVLVICKIDRIARSTQHLLTIVEDLTKRGVTFRILNVNIDTSTPTGKVMLTVLGAIAQFEREMMLERQRDGIIRAQSEKRYKGRHPSARNQTEQVMALLDMGFTRLAAARQLGIGSASVYRILRQQKAGVK